MRALSKRLERLEKAAPPAQEQHVVDEATRAFLASLSDDELEALGILLEETGRVFNEPEGRPAPRSSAFLGDIASRAVAGALTDEDRQFLLVVPTHLIEPAHAVLRRIAP